MSHSSSVSKGSHCRVIITSVVDVDEGRFSSVKSNTNQHENATINEDAETAGAGDPLELLDEVD